MCVIYSATKKRERERKFIILKNIYLFNYSLYRYVDKHQR